MDSDDDDHSYSQHMYFSTPSQRARRRRISSGSPNSPLETIPEDRVANELNIEHVIRIRVPSGGRAQDAASITQKELTAKAQRSPDKFVQKLPIGGVLMDVLTCTTCGENFRGPRMPRILPCGHNICDPCSKEAPTSCCKCNATWEVCRYPYNLSMWQLLLTLEVKNKEKDNATGSTFFPLIKDQKRRILSYYYSYVQFKMLADMYGNNHPVQLQLEQTIKETKDRLCNAKTYIQLEHALRYVNELSAFIKSERIKYETTAMYFHGSTMFRFKKFEWNSQILFEYQQSKQPLYCYLDYVDGTRRYGRMVPREMRMDVSALTTELPKPNCILFDYKEIKKHLPTDLPLVFFELSFSDNKGAKIYIRIDFSYDLGEQFFYNCTGERKTCFREPIYYLTKDCFILMNYQMDNTYESRDILEDIPDNCETARMQIEQGLVTGCRDAKAGSRIKIWLKDSTELSPPYVIGQVESGMKFVKRLKKCSGILDCGFSLELTTDEYVL